MVVMSLLKLINGRWGSGVGETDEARIDLSTNSLQIVDYPHHEIHGGSHFYLEGYATLGVAGTLFVKLVTPDLGKWSHFTCEIGSN